MARRNVSYKEMQDAPRGTVFVGNHTVYLKGYDKNSIVRIDQWGADVVDLKSAIAMSGFPCSTEYAPNQQPGDLYATIRGALEPKLKKHEDDLVDLDHVIANAGVYESASGCRFISNGVNVTYHAYAGMTGEPVHPAAWRGAKFQKVGDHPAAEKPPADTLSFEEAVKRVGVYKNGTQRLNVGERFAAWRVEGAPYQPADPVKLAGTRWTIVS